MLIDVLICMLIDVFIKLFSHALCTAIVEAMVAFIMPGAVRKLVLSRVRPTSRAKTNNSRLIRRAHRKPRGTPQSIIGNR